MKLFIKSAPHDWNVALEVVETLEAEGVPVYGVEIQILKDSVPEKVYEAVDAFRSSGLRAVGLHPGFPTFYRDVIAWANVVNMLKLDYVVYHAGSLNGYCAIREEADAVKEAVKVPVFFENLPYQERSHAKLYSPVAVAQLGDVLIDIAHTFWNHQHGKLDFPPDRFPFLLKGCVRAIHVAEQEGKDGAVIHDGTPALRAFLQEAFRHLPDAFYIGEPRGGHLNRGKGHLENALGMWKLWEEFRDNGSLI